MFPSDEVEALISKSRYDSLLERFLEGKGVGKQEVGVGFLLSFLCQSL